MNVKISSTLRNECDREAILAAIKELLSRIPSEEPAFIAVEFSQSPFEPAPVRGGMVRFSRTAPKIITELGRFVRETRGSMTQNELSKKLGCSPNLQYLSRIERGMIGRPNDEFLKALAKYTGRSVEELIAMSERPA